MSQTTILGMAEYLDARLRAERRELFVRIGAVVLAVLLVVGAGMLMPRINEIRKESQIVLDDKTLRGLPPDVALLTKMGTLRALAIDIAFIRLEELKQENRFFELMQLSDWLCKLAPRYPSVWSYSAWNMAYNISVSEYTPEARWLWVSNGIDNLRNRGLRYNDNSIKLYKELAWTFYHKVGDILDDYHWAYKLELALQMESIFGEPPLNVTGAEAVAAMRAIADAPRDWEKQEELEARHPDLAALLADLRAVRFEPDKELLRYVARYLRSYSDVTPFVASPVKLDPADAGVDLQTRRQNVLRKPEHAAALKKLLAMVRSKVLRDDYNMDPSWMLSIMEAPPWAGNLENKVCPFDWRLPWAHSLYWSTYGDMHCKRSIMVDDADAMNDVRLIFFCLKAFALHGKVVFEPDFEKPLNSFLGTSTDTSYFRHMHAAYLKYGKEQFGNDPDFVEGTSGSNFAAGHRNFLNDAIRMLYLEGGAEHLAEAKEYFFYLAQTDLEPDGTRKGRYNVTVDEFVTRDFIEALETQRGAQSLISEMLQRSLSEAANGQIDQSVAHFNEAKKWWEYYMRDVGTDRNNRRNLEPLGVMRSTVAKAYMSNPVYSLLQRYRVWRSLDTVTRKSIYDDIAPSIKEQAEAHDPPLDPEKILPVPPGMEEHRKNPKNTLGELQRWDPTVSQGVKTAPE
jgi:hypothetical protein